MTRSYGVVLRIGRLGPRVLHHLLRRIPADVPVTVLRAPGHRLAPHVERCRILEGDSIDAGGLTALARDMAVPALLLCGDDGLIALPAASSSPLAGIGVVRLLPVIGPLYRIDRADRLDRPEHYFGPVLLPVAALARCVGDTPVPLDRWIGHRVVLRAVTAGLPVANLPAGGLVLPSLAQASGADQHRGRMRSRDLLAMAGDAQTEAFAILDAMSDTEDRTLTAKRAVDAALSRLTNRLAATLAPFIPPDRRARPLPPEGRLGILKLDSIGDSVLLTSFLRTLRPWFGGEIGLMASGRVRDLVTRDPRIDRTLLVPVRLPWFAPDEATAWLDATIDQAAAFLEGVGATIIPRLMPDYYLANHIAVLAGVPRRYGLTSPRMPDLTRFNAAFTAMMTDVVTIPAPCHEVEVMSTLMRAIGGGGAAPTSSEPRCDVHLDEVDRATAWTAVPLVAGRTLVALGLGASTGRRRWPVDQVVTAARTLAGRHDLMFALLGGVDVAGDAAAVAQALGSRAYDLTGRLDLRKSAAVLERASLYIGNDSGLMHMAAAVSVPVVEISCHPLTAPDNHENAPYRFGPVGVPHRIVRPAAPADPACAQGCVSRHTAHCITGVSPTDVVAAAETLLARSAPSTALVEYG
ncbi:glycosyltransferase family 9 protein [Nitrospirillum sp. BR 11163]|uniref:glycosyltransferase family 9 protein n=1 Tax=Nitrospirillum sp. BR 11163 TaxID=3104323 RepID=UPI002AFDEA56|nr:glycosyltransferase family 9 protein [Nitrospirillum sp. BR 11163]MEA1677718.1 glycosyltransferase family 9 protein [Nitrospirillum sp. BR 11163]